MMISTYVLVAVSALATNAFIIPSTSSLSGKGSEELPSSLWGQSPAYLGDLVMLRCTGCSWTAPDPNLNSHHVESSLAMSFSLSHDSKDILLNGQPLYGASPNRLAIDVPQIPYDAPVDEIQNELHPVPVRYRELSFVLGGSTIDAADESTVKFIDLKLRVHALDHEQVQLDLIGLRVLKDVHGTLRIMDVAVIPKEEVVGIISLAPTKASMDSMTLKSNMCSSYVNPSAIFCQIRAFMRERLARLHRHSKKLRPCPSHRHDIHESEGHSPRKGASLQSWGSRMDHAEAPGASFRRGGSHPYPHPHPHPVAHEEDHHHRFCFRKLLSGMKHVTVGIILPILVAFLIGWVGGVLLLSVFWCFARLLGVGRSASSLCEENDGQNMEDEGETFRLSNSLEDQAVLKTGRSEDPPAYAEKPSL